MKQSGGTALNWFKKKWKVNQERKIPLKRTLFVQPLVIIVGAFALIFILFNLSLSLFIDEQVNQAVQHQYDTLDALYIGEEPKQIGADNIFSTTYVIVDEAHETQYMSASQDDLSASVVSGEVVRYFYDHEDEWEFFDEDDEADEAEIEDANASSHPVFITLDDTTYAVKIQEYEGQFKDYYIRQNKENDQSYYILVFANITPIQSFDRLVNWMLAILMVIVGLIASGFIYITAGKLDQAVLDLKDYIYRIGKREKELSLPSVTYEELEDIGHSVQGMSDMIDASQRSQQIFFQNASHELRTPLMSIQGYAEGIQAEVIKNPKEAAGIIQAESQKMKQLVDEILTFSRLEDIQTRLELEPVSLKDLLYDASWKMKAEADAKNLIFQHELGVGHSEIMADEDLLERAISNILKNALRYAKTTIRISCKELADGVEIAIANDGESIQSEDLPHIFERFYKGQGGQFGIGLAMTKDIVEAHHGTIRVVSHSDETCFTIFLPFLN